MRQIRSPLDGFASPFGRTQGGGISVSIGSGFVITGTELTATVNGLVGGETVSYQWTDDGGNITGATSSTYTVAIGTDSVADASAIRCVATVDGTPYTSNARTVAYAAGSFGALTNQSFAQNIGNQTYVFAAATGANLTWTYALTSPPSGVTIDSGTRTITHDTDTLSLQTGTVITVTATDQYGRAATGSPRTYEMDITVAPVLSLVADDLDQDPPTYTLNSDTAGTLRWDFHSSATPPAAGAGDIATGTESVAVGENPIVLDLSAYAGETGYLHFRIGASNILTSQQITVPSAGNALEWASANSLEWGSSNSLTWG